MVKIENLLVRWNRGNITVMEKIRIVKTLAISKLVQFLISLSSPKHVLFIDLNKKLYHFIWKHKSPKIKRHTLELYTCEEVLK